MKQCIHPGCGSHAFNLHQENVDQGELCDRHYWQYKYIAAMQRVPYLRIGEFTLLAVGSGRVRIDHDGGEGGEFDGLHLEFVIADFFRREF